MSATTGNAEIPAHDPETVSVARYLAGHPAFADLCPSDLNGLADATLEEAREIRKANAAPEQSWVVAATGGRPKTWVVTDPATWRQSQGQPQ